MKFLVSLCLFCFFVNVYSQRKINLDFELLEPLNGAFIEPGVDFKFKMKIKNLSTESISSSDTLWIYLLLDGDTVFFKPVRTTLQQDHMIFDNKPINGGDSITFWNLLQLPMSKLNKSVQFCLSVMPHNGNAVTDTITSNNGNCVQIKAQQNPASINTLQSIQNLNAYPNPASEWLNIDVAENIQLATIMDMKGSIIQTIFTPNNNRLDCSELSNGMYLLQIKTDSGIQSLSFSVYH